MSEAMYGLMGGSMIGQGVGGVLTSISQANAYKLEGQWAQQQYQFRADEADYKGKEAIQLGEEAVWQYRQQTRSLKSRQRVAYSGQSVDVGVGVAKQIPEETEQITRLAEVEIRSAARREAMGYKVAAMEDRSAGAMAYAGSRMQASNTLLAGGLRAAGDFTSGMYYGAKGGWFGEAAAGKEEA